MTLARAISSETETLEIPWCMRAVRHHSSADIPRSSLRSRALMPISKALIAEAPRPARCVDLRDFARSVSRSGSMASYSMAQVSRMIT